ncbi:T9SS type A sorting domain-containing protein [Labilibacter marinus]|uniref:T9SS type A sorting domain-containing protein n=1 Tax=Labilibacter marinus TaxID=1477105 RepID=UPI00083362BA|nr:T9SS type A sorting domain-containing protein [Labilibacter marinus]
MKKIYFLILIAIAVFTSGITAQVTSLYVQDFEKYVETSPTADDLKITYQSNDPVISSVVDANNNPNSYPVIGDYGLRFYAAVGSVFTQNIKTKCENAGAVDLEQQGVLRGKMKIWIESNPVASIKIAFNDGLNLIFDIAGSVAPANYGSWQTIETTGTRSADGSGFLVIFNTSSYLPVNSDADTRTVTVEDSEFYIDDFELVYDVDDNPTTDIDDIKINSIYNIGSALYLGVNTGDYKIYNLAGTLVQSGLAQDQVELSLPKGIYIVKVGASTAKIKL